MQRLAAFARSACKHIESSSSSIPIPKSSEELSPKLLNTTFDLKDFFLGLDVQTKERLSHYEKVVEMMRPKEGTRAKLIPETLERVSLDEVQTKEYEKKAASYDISKWPPPNKVLGWPSPRQWTRTEVPPVILERVSLELKAAEKIICDRIRNKEMPFSPFPKDWIMANLSPEDKKRLLSLESQKENLRGN